MEEIYKTEALELLDELEESLLELDEHPADMDLVNRIFRALHTIKGSGKMFGFDDVAEFTHDIETIYDAVREGELRVGEELVSLTLTSADVIRRMVNKNEVGEEVKNDLLAQFKTFLKTDSSTSEDSTNQPIEETSNSSTANEAAVIYRIRCKPLGTIFQTGTNFIPLFKELSVLGDCSIVCNIASVPELEDLNPEECYLSWDIVLTTIHTGNDIRDVFIFVEDECELEISMIESELLVESSQPHKMLGEILVEKGDIKQNELLNALNKRSLLGEELVNKQLVDSSNIEAALVEQQHVQKLRVEHQKAPVVASSIRVAADKLDNLVDLVGELVIVQARLSQYSSDSRDQVTISIAEEVERLTSELRDNTMGLRMLPIGTIFSRFKRLVRDLSNELGKEIVLEMEGGETELDKTVIEKLNDPLVHIIRNSIDHGIESPQEREGHGKNKIGIVRLVAEHCGAELLISVSDDGAGLDAGRIRAKAIEKGLIAADAEFADAEIFPLILEPGFSTATTVSDVSGRGVGMDVVKRGVESLRGSIDISSCLGKGTTIGIKLPLTLAIIDGLLVEIGHEMYVIPQAAVVECLEQTRADIENAHGNNIMNVLGEMLPYVCIRQRFGIEGEIPPSRRVVLCEVNGHRIGLAVDRVIGSYQTVIKPLGEVYKRVECISGATILGDGNVALIIDPAKLIPKETSLS